MKHKHFYKFLLLGSILVLSVIALLLLLKGSGRDKQENFSNDICNSEDNQSISTEDAITFTTENTEEPVLSHEEIQNAKIESMLQDMTLEQKIAQMFFITPEALTGYTAVTATGDTSKSSFDRYPVGGLVYFAQNLQEPEQTKQMLSGIYDYALETQQIPVFLGVDEEGGRVLRIGKNDAFHVPKVDAMGTLANTGNSDIIYDAASTIGSYLFDLGFNVDFAPDADVITNSQNTVIGDRSFGTNPDQVAEMANIYKNGLHDSGILAAYKHFPGHGGTTEDSHTGYAFSYKTLDELKESELVPFQSGCENGIDFIMVSHISTPNVTSDNTPATLSEIWLTNILREDMEYNGIIITDSMAMGAITEHYSSADATILAVTAGCDMILMPQDFQVSYSALLEAVNNDEIPESRIDESVRRILAAKLELINTD